jgi:hypothetical protein
MTFGESFHLHRDARVYPDKLKGYLRMSKEKFYALLKKIELHVCGPGTNNRESMYSEQRLVITVVKGKQIM